MSACVSSLDRAAFPLCLKCLHQRPTHVSKQKPTLASQSDKDQHPPTSLELVQGSSRPAMYGRSAVGRARRKTSKAAASWGRRQQ